MTYPDGPKRGEKVVQPRVVPSGKRTIPMKPLPTSVPTVKKKKKRMMSEGGTMYA